MVASDGGDTVKNGGLTVKLSGSKGEALLAKDSAEVPEGTVSDAYDLVLLGDTESPVTLTMDAPQSEEGTDVRIKVGLPYVDTEGKEDFLWVPLDTAQNGNTVTAEVDPTEYEGAVDGLRHDGNGVYTDGSEGFGERIMESAGKKKKSREAVYTYRILQDSAYCVKSGEGHFSVNIPVEMFNKAEAVVKRQLRQEDAIRLGDDLEALLAGYKKDFPRDTRSKWPIPVEYTSDKDMAGMYGGSRRQNGCLFYINYNKLAGSYKDGGKYDTESVRLYHTLAHEMFHFIQMEYTNPLLSAV